MGPHTRPSAARRGFSRATRALAARYATAVAVIVAAASIQRVLWTTLPPSPHLFFYPAVLLVAWLVGFWPALVAVSLSLLFILTWFLSPYGAFWAGSASDVLDLAIYGVMATMLAFLVDRVRRAERKARLAIEAAPIPTVLLSADRRVVYANPAMVETVGYAADELRGRPFRELVHDGDAHELDRLLGELGERERARAEEVSPEQRFSARFIGSSGNVLLVAGTLASLHAYGTERYIVQVVDVTQRRRAEVDRNIALARLRAVIEQCPEGIVVMQEDGEVLASNAAAHEIWGTSFPLDMGAATPLQDRDGRPLAAHERPLVRALAGERITGFEVMYRRPDGTVVPLLVNAAPVAAPELGVRTAVSVFQDISSMKELEQLRAQWNAVVAHDLRQPIHSILLRTGHLARTSDAKAADLEALARATRRLNDMVEDLFDASLLEPHRLVLERRALDLAAIVEDRVEAARQDAPGRAFDVDVDDPDLHAWVDPQRVAQVMDNLLSNAVKYGSPESAVRVRLGRAPQGLWVEVENDGDGIPPDEVPHLFDRFRRTKNAISRGIGGTGLGLYIVRELMLAHGGDVVCTSAPDGTTTFRVTFPARSEGAEAHAAWS